MLRNRTGERVYQASVTWIERRDGARGASPVNLP
jgi:hypothetical protein